MTEEKRKYLGEWKYIGPLVSVYSCVEFHEEPEVELEDQKKDFIYLLLWQIEGVWLCMGTVDTMEAGKELIDSEVAKATEAGKHGAFMLLRMMRVRSISINWDMAGVELKEPPVGATIN